MPQPDRLDATVVFLLKNSRLLFSTFLQWFTVNDKTRILFYLAVSSGPKDDSELDYTTLKGAGEGTRDQSHICLYARHSKIEYRYLFNKILSGFWTWASATLIYISIFVWIQFLKNSANYIVTILFGLSKMLFTFHVSYDVTSWCIVFKNSIYYLAICTLTKQLSPRPSKCPLARGSFIC